MVVGAEIGHDWPECRGLPAGAVPGVPAPHQDDHRAPALRHPGGGHRGPRRLEGGRSHGREGARLLRDRHHPRSLHRPRRHQPHPGRGGGEASARAASARRDGGEADLLGRDPPRLPRERGEGGGRGARAADRGLQRPVRDRARPAPGDEAPPRARSGPGPVRDDVQVHEPRDVLRPGRGGRGHRLHRGPHGPGDPHEPVQAARHLVRGPRRFPAPRAPAGGPHRPRAPATIHLGHRRAGIDRVRHHELRGRPAPGHGADGGAGRAAIHRGLRDAHGLQLQPRRLHALPVPRLDLRGPGRGHPPEPRRSSS